MFDADKLKKDADKIIKSKLFPDNEALPDRNEEEALLTDFRRSYAKFFEDKIVKENSPIQEQATQIYWNILQFHKKRLEKLGIRLEFDSERMNYGQAENSVVSLPQFDGRYLLTRVKEHIAASCTFFKGNRKIHHKKYKQAAFYTLLSAETRGDGLIICPNCGNPTTRENLIDGCDYCGTKFTVEDLGTRVGDFALRDDVGIEFAKMKKNADAYMNWLYALTFSISFVISFGLCYLFIDSDGFFGGTVTYFLCLIGISAVLSAIVCAAVRAMLYEYIMRATGLEPLVELYRHTSYRAVDNLEHQDTEAERMVQRYDELFSISDFYSGLQNKLAAIHYADNKEQINAFTVVDLGHLLAKYKNVINIDTEEIILEDYFVDGAYQVATARVKLNVLLNEAMGARSRIEKLRVQLVKSADCKTQAVCGPSVLRCRGCGASLSLLEGKACHYCGRELDLSQYDWVISDYKIEMFL